MNQKNSWIFFVVALGLGIINLTTDLGDYTVTLWCLIAALVFMGLIARILPATTPSPTMRIQILAMVSKHEHTLDEFTIGRTATEIYMHIDDLRCLVDCLNMAIFRVWKRDAVGSELHSLTVVSRRSDIAMAFGTDDRWVRAVVAYGADKKIDFSLHVTSYREILIINDQEFDAWIGMLMEIADAGNHVRMEIAPGPAVTEELSLGN